MVLREFHQFIVFKVRSRCYHLIRWLVDDLDSRFFFMKVENKRDFSGRRDCLFPGFAEKFTDDQKITFELFRRFFSRKKIRFFKFRDFRDFRRVRRGLRRRKGLRRWRRQRPRSLLPRGRQNLEKNQLELDRGTMVRLVDP